MRRFALRVPLLVLFGALEGCASVGGTPLKEVVELFTMGRTRQMQQPLRDIRGETRVLIFALDGVGRDALLEALRSGRMPHLSGLLGPEGDGGLYANAYAANGVLSILPSTTMPAWAAVFTGAPPAVNGVAGNEWFAPDEGEFYAPVPVTVTSRSHAAKIFTDEFVSHRLRAPTLYEQLPDVRMHVSMSPVYRGADLVSFPDPAQLGDLVGVIVGESIAGSVKKSARVARETDETSTGSLLDVIGSVGLPDVQTVYFNGIDLMTHYAEEPLAEQQRYLEAVTDSLIGKVLDAYRTRGALDDTYVVVVADHGHTPVLPDERNALGVGGEGEPPAVLEHAGFRVRPFSLTSSSLDHQAVLAYQGFFAYVYLADRATCPETGAECDWSRPPRLEEDVLPVVRAFHRASADGVGVPEMRGSLDLVFARFPAGTGPFHIFDGERLVPIAGYLRANPRPDLLRLEERLQGLSSGPHARNVGDVLLLSQAGIDRPIGERYYFGEPQYSEHGSPHAQDSRIPLMLARPGRSGAELRRLIESAIGASPSQLDVARLVRALVGESGDPPPSPTTFTFKESPRAAGHHPQESHPR